MSTSVALAAPAPALPTAGAYWFDESAAEAACAFFERYLRHTEAEWYGRPFILQAWQRKIIRQMFGWKQPDGLRR